jgi:hypothetical protein
MSALYAGSDVGRDEVPLEGHEESDRRRGQDQAPARMAPYGLAARDATLPIG